VNHQLSTHFPLEEFTRSQLAARMGLTVVPTQADEANLTRLCETVLEPIRTLLGKPIVVSSGLRPIWLNDAAHGSKTSAHIDGRAADVYVSGMQASELARWIRNHDFPEVDQCICEFGQWVHLAIAKRGEAPRRQYLTAIHDAVRLSTRRACEQASVDGHGRSQRCAPRA
jgi:zinc D-Ala-D-Ala carboxypeptidase